MLQRCGFAPLFTFRANRATLLSCARYPSRCAVEEDVTLGCHQAALMWGARDHLVKELSVQGIISFERIYSFLYVLATPAALVRVEGGGGRRHLTHAYGGGCCRWS